MLVSKFINILCKYLNFDDMLFKYRLTKMMATYLTACYAHILSFTQFLKKSKRKHVLFLSGKVQRH